jgi:hypothetical protein
MGIYFMLTGSGRGADNRANTLVNRHQAAYFICRQGLKKMKTRPYFLATLLALIFSTVWAEEKVQGLSDKDIDRAVEKIKSVLPEGYKVAEVKKGYVGPVGRSFGDGVEIIIIDSRTKVEEKDRMKSPYWNGYTAGYLYLMSPKYEDSRTPSDLEATIPAFFLGKSRLFQIWEYSSPWSQWAQFQKNHGESNQLLKALDLPLLDIRMKTNKAVYVVGNDISVEVTISNFSNTALSIDSSQSSGKCIIKNSKQEIIYRPDGGDEIQKPDFKLNDFPIMPPGMGRNYTFQLNDKLRSKLAPDEYTIVYIYTSAISSSENGVLNKTDHPEKMTIESDPITFKVVADR